MKKKEKPCRTCGNNFLYYSLQDLDCQQCRTNANIKSSNANWLTREPKKRTKQQTNNIGYAFKRTK